MQLKQLKKDLKHSIFLAKKRVQYQLSQPGSVDWLVGTELKFGGIETNVPRNKVSPNDPRTKAQLQKGGMIGGDRMYHHGYADKYAEFLAPFVKQPPKTVVEAGILKGTGLAIWCDLFPKARVLGLDIDLNHIQSNMANLEKRGAFRENRPELYEYDQLIDNTEYVRALLKGDTIDVCIDDGLHSHDSILTTMDSLLPFLSKKFVYFIEDNDTVHEKIREKFTDFYVENVGELTVVTNND
ncbi:MAG: hypothetical protein MI867_04425 [Pseudomonadales bacterium]|nr:hypothetical protein [Pseudomonadales bacterium]